MGKYDSSRTRVAPVFDALMDRDRTGRTWLPPLLRLGSRSAGRVDAITAGSLPPDHPRWWGKHERRLDPPLSLLQWLVRNATAPASRALSGDEETRAKRESLIARDPATIAEALQLLQGPSATRAWYVLEGRSQPDALIETETVLLVVEGKRTERKATVATTWMRRRSQMLRHMDAAWEVRSGRRVLGLMIVEGQRGIGETTPSEHWLREADEQVLEETLTASLPHRTPADRDQIAGGFLGVTTWQKVCSALGLPWPPGGDSDVW